MPDRDPFILQGLEIDDFEVSDVAVEDDLITMKVVARAVPVNFIRMRITVSDDGSPTVDKGEDDG